MPPPAPPVKLKEHCSVIHHNVLYVYSPDALQSLPLQKDAKWSQEPMGVSVRGAKCVLGNMDGDHSRAALYVVGGSTNSSSLEYPGLQRYSLHDRKWDNVTPVSPVTQNRRHHGAAFLNASSSILVYAGSQDGDSRPSTETFMIQTWPPYNVLSFVSLAPPVMDPTMLTWSDNRAGTVGGSPPNSRVFTFGPDDGWTDAVVTVEQPRPDSSAAQSILLSLVDDSKVLVTFDLSQSPNTVTRTVVLNPGGNPAQYGETIGDNGTVSQVRRREVLLSTFPEYNDTLAPQTVRIGASSAQDPSGLTVITGGNEQDPLSIFDAVRNEWVDPTKLLGDQSPTTSSGSQTPTVPIPTASESSSSAPTTPSSKSSTSIILGAVLGSICGIAAILIIALLLLRWKKQKKRKPAQSGFPPDKKQPESRLSSEDQGRQPIKGAAQPMGRSTFPASPDPTIVGGHPSHSRHSSSTSSRLKHDPRRSNNFSFGPGLFSRSKSPLPISRPIPHAEPAELQERPSTSRVRPTPTSTVLDPAASHRKNDSSWSTYFSGNTAVDIPENSRNVVSPASPASSGSRGSYWPDPAAPVAKPRAAMAGLTDSNGNQLARMNVQTGNPSIGHSAALAGHSVAVTEGIPAKISHTDSMATSITDDYAPRPTVDNGKSGASAHPTGQPIGDYSWAFQDSSWSGPPHRLTRPPSSTYTSSISPPNVTSPKGDDWSKSSVRPVTQWPSDSTNLPAASTSRPGTSRGLKASARPDRSADEFRDFFGSHVAREHSNRGMSWLNLNGNGDQNSSGDGTGHR